MPIGYSNEDRMSSEDKKPIIESDDLPEMAAEVDAPIKMSESKGKRMASTEQLMTGKPASTRKGKGNYMEPFTPNDEPERPEPATPEEKYPVHDDIAETPPIADRESEGYVRLRLRVENGGIKIVGARAVDGPLLVENAVRGELGFETRLGQQRLVLGTILDAGEIRSFPPPKPTAEIWGHNIIETGDFEFSVRIPRQFFTRDMLKDLEIDVFRIKGDLSRLQECPEITAYERDELRMVAKLRGMPPDVLADNVQEQIEAILGGKQTR